MNVINNDKMVTIYEGLYVIFNNLELPTMEDYSQMFDFFLSVHGINICDLSCWDEGYSIDPGECMSPDVRSRFINMEGRDYYEGFIEEINSKACSNKNVFFKVCKEYFEDLNGLS